MEIGYVPFAVFAVVLVAVALVAGSTYAPAGDSKLAEYRSIVVFRDDDVQVGYEFEAMKRVNEVLVSEGVPATRAVIPLGMDDPSSRECRYLRTMRNRHPDLFEYALHGYTHRAETDFHGGSEFGGLPRAEQLDRIEKGTKAMKRCLKRAPTTFVPPFDTYDEATLSVLRERGFTAVSGGSGFTEAYFDRTEPFVADGIRQVPSTRSFVKNWTTHEFYGEAELRAGFDRAYENGSVYVQEMHYFTFTDAEKLDRLRSFIRYVKGHDDVRFMTVGQFAGLLDAGKLRRTDSGWILIEETPARSVLDRLPLTWRVDPAEVVA